VPGFGPTFTGLRAGQAKNAKSATCTGKEHPNAAVIDMRWPGAVPAREHGRRVRESLVKASHNAEHPAATSGDIVFERARVHE
jgi:hypothetical protein